MPWYLFKCFVITQNTALVTLILWVISSFFLLLLFVRLNKQKDIFLSSLFFFFFCILYLLIASDHTGRMNSVLVYRASNLTSTESSKQTRWSEKKQKIGLFHIQFETGEIQRMNTDTYSLISRFFCFFLCGFAHHFFPIRL